MSYRNLLLSILLIVFFVTPVCFAQHLKPKIIMGPVEFRKPPEYYPHILFKLEISEIFNYCYFMENKPCPPPPPSYMVIVWRQSPNDPNCYQEVFKHTLLYPFGWIIGPGEVIHESERNRCCFGFHCGSHVSRYEVGPLRSGKYRIEVQAKNYPDWVPAPDGCDPDEFPSEWWGTPIWLLTDDKFVKIEGELCDYIGWSNLFYIDQNTGDYIYDEQYLHVLGKYRAVCTIVTTKLEEDIPSSLSGYLKPNGGTVSSVSFLRWTQGDISVPCEFDLPYTFYAYRSDPAFMPIDLWHFTPEEWEEGIKRDLTCKLKGSENHIPGDISIKVYVQHLLYLDCLNDSTICFIPANGEILDFIFSYSRDLGLSEESDIDFQIYNRIEELVYSEDIILNGPDDHQPPFLKFPLFWDGRCNQSPVAEEGHLADPEMGPYSAFVYVNEGEGIQSNTEEFDVVPAIDSVIITHHPWYYPPDPIFADDISMYSVIVGKVDDQGSDNDFRFYLSNASDFPYGHDHHWDKSTYLYTDGAQPVYDFYEDLESSDFDRYPVRRWRTNDWGELEYRWWVIHDVRQGTSGIDYSFKQDTTQWWGDDWQVYLTVPVNEEDRKRLLVYNEIYHRKNDYDVQNAISDIDAKAHKVIFGPIVDPTYGRDNIYWSSTHIGVPYGIGIGIKKAYKHIDCSGFCVATQIQENGGPLLSDGHIIDLDCTSADHLVRDCKPGVHTTREVDDAQTMRGDMIGINPEDDTPPPWGHIANISFVEYDFINNRFIRLYVYEAKGNTNEANPGPLNLIRNVDGLFYYINRNFHYKCVRWDY